MKQLVVSVALIAALVAAASRARAEGCDFENYAYFDGQVVCQFGLKMKCVQGEWVQTGDRCYASDAKEAVGGAQAVPTPGGVDMAPHEAESPPDVEVHH